MTILIAEISDFVLNINVLKLWTARAKLFHYTWSVCA